MLHGKKRVLGALLALAILTGLAPATLADGAVTLMPGVTPEMSDASFWADRQYGADEVILTPEEIEAFNLDSAEREGTMVMDLRTAGDTYDRKAYNENLEKSARRTRSITSAGPTPARASRPTGTITRR